MKMLTALWMRRWGWALGWIWNEIRFRGLDHDPDQPRLIDVLGEAAIAEEFSGVEDASASVFLYVVSQGWPKKEAIRRLDHAVAAIVSALG
jgi:hypothetical protein